MLVSLFSIVTYPVSKLLDYLDALFEMPKSIHYEEERMQMIKLVEKLRCKYQQQKVDVEFDNTLKESLITNGLKPREIGSCDPYRCESSETIYTDVVSTGDVYIYITYRKDRETKDRIVTDIAFHYKGSRYFPSNTTLDIFIDHYESIKEYDRSFLG